MSRQDSSDHAATEAFLRQAIELALANVEQGGRPFGAVLVKDGKVIATGVNEIHRDGDPTAHAELLAIRRAAQALGSPRLDGCVVYASGHPCPMCLSAMYLSGVAAATYAYDNAVGEHYGLSTAAIYGELAKPQAAQKLPIACHPIEMKPGEGARPHLYETWRRRQGCAP